MDDEALRLVVVAVEKQDDGVGISGGRGTRLGGVGSVVA